MISGHFCWDGAKPQGNSRENIKQIIVQMLQEMPKSHQNCWKPLSKKTRCNREEQTCLRFTSTPLALSLVLSHAESPPSWKNIA